MAETQAAGKGLGATLAKKVGPLPLGVWLAAGGGLYLYFRHQQQGQAGAAGQAGQTPPGYGTDPAGNCGLIDPNTGYVAGSSEDIAAQQLAGGTAAGGGGFTSGLGGATGSIDTGGGVSTTPSGTATSTPGAPAPATPTPGPPAAPAKGWHYPAPSGLAASAVSDSGYQLSWSPVQGPQGQKPSTYTVATYQANGVKVDQFTVGGTTAREYGAGGKGLHPGWTYRSDVWANGGPTAPPHASVVVTVKPKGQK